MQSPTEYRGSGAMYEFTPSELKRADVYYVVVNYGSMWYMILDYLEYADMLFDSLIAPGRKQMWIITPDVAALLQEKVNA